MLWSEEEKAMVGLAVGCLTYTSSGESDFSEDENGERHLTKYLVKKSPVERSRKPLMMFTSRAFIQEQG